MSYEEIIQVPCTVLRDLPNLDELINVVIDHYYEVGFPYYEIDNKKIEKEFNYLKDYDVSKLELPSNRLEQNMNGLNTVNSFHPEMWSIRCNNAKTPMEIFNDRDLFHEALKKRVKYSDTKLAPYNIRKSLKAFGSQSVSNFRPTVAKWVYQNFCPPGGSVLDPCMGFGGRLFGALASHVGTYVGVDPCIESVEGNVKMLNRLAFWNVLGKCVSFYRNPFEDLNLIQTFDTVFTSPPYFNIEKYPDTGLTQSYIRYRTYDQWRDEFLKNLIQTSYKLLNDGGYLVLNVGEPITNDTLEIGSLMFNAFPETYYMRLSKILGNGTKKDESHKEEPIFVWKKQ